MTLRKSCPCFIIGTLSFLSLATSLVATDRPEQPNILFIFADDWGWGDLSCHGHPYIQTPNIDRLAREGTDFHRFTVASGVCSPSRTAVMTGHFPARYNIDGHFAWVPSFAVGIPLVQQQRFMDTDHSILLHRVTNVFNQGAIFLRPPIMRRVGQHVDIGGQQLGKNAPARDYSIFEGHFSHAISS